MPVLEAPRTATRTNAGAGAKARRRPPKWVLPVAVAWTVAIVLGLVLRARHDGTSTNPQAGFAPQVTVAGVEDGAPTQFQPLDENVGPAAATAAAAATRYLDAEIAGDYGTSFAQLSAGDRADIGSHDDWLVRHDELPVYVAYRVVSSTDAEVTVEATLEPQVNEAVGVVPASAEIRFALVSEDGGYRISLRDTEVTANYPSESLAGPAASAWIDAARHCASRTELEYAGTLVGDLGIAERLCGVTGSTAAGEAHHLDALADPTAVVNAFGADATDWSRVVTVTGLDGVAPLQIVLAPYGDHWVVVGVFAES